MAMAGRPNRRRSHPSNSTSPDSTSYTSTPGQRSRTPSPSCKQPLRQHIMPHHLRGESNDNPLYEDIRLPVPPRQGIPNVNPLYRHDLYHGSNQSCMTDFLKPKGSRPRSANKMPGRDRYGKLLYQATPDNYRPPQPPSTDYGRQHRHTSSRPELMAPPTFSVDPSSRAYPPTRFSSRQSLKGQDSKNVTESTNGEDSHLKSSRSRDASHQQHPMAALPSVRDLVAAVRSDQKLLKAEVRKDGTGREPRIPGDHDRFFHPRKGDIIVHAYETADKKLVEYYDEGRMMEHLQPGDKLVRVKYDNYTIPDHLMITSKLYIYVPEWVYLGKALQTIKTA